MRHALLVLALLLLPPLAGLAPAAAQEGGDERPNVVLVLTDDLDTASLRHMPNVSALLGDKGTTFSNFIVSTPLCCPSRATILRGQYVHNHGVRFNFSPGGGFPQFHERAERSTVARWLQAAGYRTALVGKYLNEYPAGVPETFVPPGWDEWTSAVHGKYFNYDLNQNGRIVHHGKRAREYQTDIESRLARGWVAKAAKGGPFFLYLAPRAPHKPAIAAPRHKGEFGAETAPRTPAFNEDDVGDKPRWVQGWKRLDAQRVAQIDRVYRQRLRSLLAVDDMVRDLVATLEATGELDNTYIFFTSDNGWMSGAHRIEGKGQPYEDSIRVPLVVRGPDVPAGRTEDRLALNADLAPTFADLAGAEVPAFVDGRSLAPLLRGEQAVGWRDAVLVEYFGRDGPRVPGVGVAGIPGSVRHPPYLAVRTEDHVYVVYATRERELYDLRADPHQLDNLLAEGREPPPEAEVLAARLAALRRCAGDGCRAADGG